MKKHIFIYLILFIALISCSPQVSVDEEPDSPVTSEESGAEDAPADGPSPNEPNEDEDMDSSAEDETNADNNQVDAEATPTASKDNLVPAATPEKSTPSSVDLGDLVDPEPSDDEPVEQPAPGVPIPSGSMALVNDVQVDLSQKLNVDVDNIQTVLVEEVQWRDSSLGCPIEGMAYLQVITPGFRILLSVDGETYHYHSRDTSNFVLCENPQTPSIDTPPPGLGDT